MDIREDASLREKLDVLMNSRGASKVIVLGSDEIKNNEYTLKEEGQKPRKVKAEDIVREVKPKY